MKIPQILYSPIFILAWRLAALDAGEDPREIWDLEILSKPPATFPAPGFEAEGMKSLFYQGLPWKGKSTRVFTWFGAPSGKEREKLPAMVLVHGGGGTAFEDWVRLWTGRGYAALAMDLCGCTPGEAHGKRPRHEWGGPPGWGGFDQIDWPREDQWTYHAVADIILAHSLLRSFPEIDPERIGITGISWGGYLTCIVSGIDQRFRFSVPVYGCGFLGENSCWLGTFENMGREKSAAWLRLWDPSRFLPHSKMPMLWVTGTNDFAYPLDSLQRSYRLPSGERTLCVRIRMAHAHGGPGENPEEIHAFAKHFFKGGVPLAKITGQGREGSRVWVKFESKSRVIQAQLNSTKEKGPWKERNWSAIPAIMDRTESIASGALPEGISVYYFNLIDRMGLVVSSEHVETNQTVIK